MASSISSMLLSGLLASYHCLHTILRTHIQKEISVAYIRLGHCWNSIHHTLLPIHHLCTPPPFLPLHSFHQQEQHHQWCRKLVLKWEWWQHQVCYTDQKHFLATEAIQWTQLYFDQCTRKAKNLLDLYIMHSLDHMDSKAWARIILQLELELPLVRFIYIPVAFRIKQDYVQCYPGWSGHKIMEGSILFIKSAMYNFFILSICFFIIAFVKQCRIKQQHKTLMGI